MQKKFTRAIIILIFIIFIISILFKVFDIKTFLMKKMYKQEYTEYVNKYAEINEIDPTWIYAIIKVESNFNKDALSDSGAKGLMQLIDSTATEIAKQLDLENFDTNMLFDPEINIMIGTRYFNTLLDKYNDNYYLAIAAYNGRNRKC